GTQLLEKGVGKALDRLVAVQGVAVGPLRLQDTRCDLAVDLQRVVTRRAWAGRASDLLGQGDQGRGDGSPVHLSQVVEDQLGPGEGPQPSASAAPVAQETIPEP